MYHKYKEITYAFTRQSHQHATTLIEELNKEILELEPYQLLLTIHDAMIVPESFSEEVKEGIIKAVENRLNLTPKGKGERVN